MSSQRCGIEVVQLQVLKSFGMVSLPREYTTLHYIQVPEYVEFSECTG